MSVLIFTSVLKIVSPLIARLRDRGCRVMREQSTIFLIRSGTGWSVGQRYAELVAVCAESLRPPGSHHRAAAQRLFPSKPCHEFRPFGW